LTVGAPLLGLAVGLPNLYDGDSAGGVTLVVLSTIVGPSLGWFYAGRPGMALETMGVRAIGGVLLLYGLNPSLEGQPTDGNKAMAWSGAALMIGATLVDLIGPASVISRDNERARMAVVPTMHRGGGGLALAGSF